MNLNYIFGYFNKFCIENAIGNFSIDTKELYNSPSELCNK